MLSLALALNSLPALSQDRVEVDFRCLTGGESNPVHLEWRTFADVPTKWVAAYVRYQKSRTPITLVFKSSEATETPKGRPWAFTSHWLEVVDGQVSGEYVVVSQGANIYGFRYTNFRSRKTTDFWQDLAAMQGDACVWN